MSDAPASAQSRLSRELTICNSRGLHARASAKFVKLADSFDCEITVTRDGQTVPGTSIMGLMMLAAHPGATILVEAEGEDAAAALDALAALVAERFGEED
ncbi:MAG: HPr family phosphocarrier protein [Parvibaculaceae bacterium]